MLGFINVSHMSNRDVQRMGHADDYDEIQPGYGSTPARRNPVLQVGYAVSDVWAAACAAQRINDGYFKEFVYEHTEGQSPRLVKNKNRNLMLEFLQNPDRLSVDDVEAGEALRVWLQNDLTFRALKSQLTEFDTAAQKCLAVQDRFYTVLHRYELAVIACLPNSKVKADAKAQTQDRLRETSGELIGNIKDKVTLNVEVIRCVYSRNWNCWFATAVTTDNRAVFFSNKESFDVGTHLTIKGTVKAHKDGQTQLNRVSVI